MAWRKVRYVSTGDTRALGILLGREVRAPATRRAHRRPQLRSVMSLMPSCLAARLMFHARALRLCDYATTRCISLEYLGAPRLRIERSRVASARNSSNVIFMRASVSRTHAQIRMPRWVPRPPQLRHEAASSFVDGAA